MKRGWNTSRLNIFFWKISNNVLNFFLVRVITYSKKWLNLKQGISTCTAGGAREISEWDVEIRILGIHSLSGTRVYVNNGLLVDMPQKKAENIRSKPHLTIYLVIHCTTIQSDRFFRISLFCNANTFGLKLFLCNETVMLIDFFR